MNKKISVSTAITIAIIAMTVTFSVTMILARQIFDRTIPSVKEKESMYSKIAEIDKYVRANYYGDISDETLNDMIGYGYVLGTGDKNASYYTARQFNELLAIQNGSVMGVGVDLVKDTSGYGRIVAVYDGSPAEDVGMEIGGFVTSIDGSEVKGMTTENILAKLRGEGGTDVKVGYMAPDGTTNEYTINRRAYLIPSVNFNLFDDGIGYIRIQRFDGSTLNQFSRAVNTLQDGGAKGLVLDLRDNGGGLLSAATDCMDILVPRGDLVWAEYKNGERKLLGESDESSVNLPMVVMVNRNTASSAELFAQTLREKNGAQLMGEKTMGKGTIQAEPHRMSDGSAVVVTVARMLTGNETAFDGTGLEVDVEVAAKPGAENQFNVESDTLIQQAVSLTERAAGIQADNSTQEENTENTETEENTDDGETNDVGTQTVE